MSIHTIKNAEPNLDLSVYTPENPMKILSISHTDLDGYSCTILIKLIEKCVPNTSVENVNISPNRLASYLDNIRDTLMNYDRIWITDLSVTQDVVNIVNELNLQERVHVFDHHMVQLTEIPSWVTIAKYAKDDPYSEVHHIEGEENAADWLTCATMIMYNFLQRTPFWKYIRDAILDEPCGNGDTDNINHYCWSVESYDTFSFWQKQMDGTLDDYIRDMGTTYMIDGPRINALYHAIDRDLFEKYITDYIMCAMAAEQMTQDSRAYPWVGRVIDIEMARNELYNETALKRLTIFPFKKTLYKNGKVHNLDYTIGIVFAEKNGPAIGNAACYKIPNIDFCAVVSNNQVSFYTTKENLKVCEIAALFGGGGHDAAAGFTISYQSANIYNTNHFFNIINCAGKIVPSPDESVL